MRENSWKKFREKMKWSIAKAVWLKHWKTKVIFSIAIYQSTKEIDGLRSKTSQKGREVSWKHYL